MTFLRSSDPLIGRLALLVVPAVATGVLGFYFASSLPIEIRAPMLAAAGLLSLLFATIEAYSLGRLPDADALDGLAGDRRARQLRSEVHRVRRATLADTAMLSIVGAFSLSFASSLPSIAKSIGGRATWALVLASLGLSLFGLVAALMRAQLTDRFAKSIADERRRLERRVERLESQSDLAESLAQLHALSPRPALPFNDAPQASDEAADAAGSQSAH